MKFSKTNKKADKDALQKEKHEKKLVKKQAPKYEKMGVDELVPLVKKHNDYDCYVMEDGSLLAIYGIVQKNLQGAPEMDVSFDITKWDKLYKIYSDDLKIVTSNFLTDTRTQLEYYDHLLERADGAANTNESLRSLLEQKRYELQWISENRHEINASLFVYATSLDDLREKDRRIRTTLSGLVYDYDESLRRKIIHMLYNKTEAL